MHYSAKLSFENCRFITAIYLLSGFLHRSYICESYIHRRNILTIVSLRGWRVSSITWKGPSQHTKVVQYIPSQIISSVFSYFCTFSALFQIRSVSFTVLFHMHPMEFLYQYYHTGIQELNTNG